MTNIALLVSFQLITNWTHYSTEYPAIMPYVPYGASTNIKVALNYRGYISKKTIGTYLFEDKTNSFLLKEEYLSFSNKLYKTEFVNKDIYWNSVF